MLYIIWGSISLMIVFLSILGWMYINDPTRKDSRYKELQKSRQQAKERVRRETSPTQGLYRMYRRLAILRTTMNRMELAYRQIGERDNRYLERKIVYILTSFFLIAFVMTGVFWSVTGNVFYTVIFIVFLYYIGESYIEFFLQKGHHRLMEQSIGFLDLMRQKYYEYGVVDDAVYEAMQLLDPEEREMAAQGEAIYEVLTASDQEKAMLAYQESAPNTYLKMLVNFAQMTQEYGDQKQDGHSVFLMNLGFLSKSIHLALDKQRRLNYALKSMHAIVVIPLFCITPIRGWAVHNFPPLGQFYSSAMGKTIEIITIVMMLLAMILLNRISRMDTEREKMQRTSFIERLPIPLSEEQKQRWVYGVVLSVLVLLLICSVQIQQRYSLRERVLYEEGFLMTSVDAPTSAYRLEESKKDYAIVSGQVEGPVDRDSVELWVKEHPIEIGNDETMQEAQDTEASSRVQRILMKRNIYQKMGFMWWQWLFVMMAGIIGYHVPSMDRWFKKRVRAMESEEEIATFQSLIMMLMHHPRMSAIELAQWLENEAKLFKEPLHRCLLNMSMGHQEAFDQLGSEVNNDDMRRIAHQLAMASEDISVVEAFDELVQEKQNYFEKRKWLNDRLVERKVLLGQNIGFIPAYVLIILYMIVPMIVSSVGQLDHFFQAIN